MKTTTISSKYQILIPKKIREETNLKPGIKLEVIPYKNRIELVPLENISKLKGILKGINTDIKRDKDRI